MVPFLVVVRWFGAHLSPALTRFKNMTRNRQLRFSCVCHSVHHHFHRVCGQSSQLRTLQVTNSSRTKNHQAANKQSYFHTAHHHQSLYNLLHSYMARKQQQEECIYNWGPLGGSAAAADAAATVAVPRVKTYNYSAPPAAAPRRMHEDSSQVESILKPVRGIRDAQRRAGITPTNHSRHNIQAVKEQSRLNALQKAQQQDERISAATGGLRRQSGAGSRHAGAGASGGRQQQQQPSRSSSLGSAGDLSTARDFVEENKLAAAAAAARRPVKAEAKAGAGAGEYLHKSDFGQVPTYLLERKLQLAQEHEARMAAKAAAAIPAGLRQMPESERLETLALLQQNRQEVEAKLSALPITVETHSMRRHKEDLERRLAEIEEARRIFSRPNVLVQAKP